MTRGSFPMHINRHSQYSKRTLYYYKWKDYKWKDCHINVVVISVNLRIIFAFMWIIASTPDLRVFDPGWFFAFISVYLSSN